MAAAEPTAELPIAVFDSGVGGLTVLHECLVSLPEEDFVYLGDDARFPYGARSDEELRSHVEQVIAVPARARGEAARDRLQLGRVGRAGGRARGGGRAAGSRSSR